MTSIKIIIAVQLNLLLQIKISIDEYQKKNNKIIYNGYIYIFVCVLSEKDGIGYRLHD